MLWLCLPLFSLAFALRVRINQGHTWGTPDEKTYSTYAQVWRPNAKVYAPFILRFLDSKTLDDIPPTRYAFYALCSGLVALLKQPAFQTVTWVAAVAGSLVTPVAYCITGSIPAALLVGSSALSLVLSRRAFQDTFGALTLLLGLWAVNLQNPWLLGVAVFLALASREALALYLPALCFAWALHGAPWPAGAASVAIGVGVAVGGFYALGGSQLMAIFKKLRQSTDYVRRFQSGTPHRVVTDLILVSPVTTLSSLVACSWAPWWLIGFVGVGALTHAFITPKNARFLLAVDLGIRMLCAWLPGPWPWVVLVFGGYFDFKLYRAFSQVRDTVTYNLVVASNMYSENNHGPR